MNSQSSINRRIKPTLDTPFHIDYSWWERDEQSLRIYLASHLPTERQAAFSAQENGELVDWIDPETAEVKRIDGLTVALREAAESEDFIGANTSMVDAIFRVLLTNDNTPVTPRELADVIGRPPEMILRTLSGTRVYKGIRPAID